MKFVQYLILFVVLIICVCGCKENMMSSSKELVKLEPVIIENPVKRSPELADGTDLYRLAFTMQPSWMEGSIELRLPEVLQSDMGMHFLDHYRTTIFPINEIDPLPQWQRDEATGALYYDGKTEEGMVFGARVTPSDDEVALELYVTNNTSRDLDFVEANPCLDLKESSQFKEQFNLNNLFIVFDGKYQSLANTTPTPDEIGRDPWLLILTEKGSETFDGPKVSPTWWRTDQPTDKNLMASKSADGKYLIGYTWDIESHSLMTNCGNPCMHTGPGAVTNLKKGQTHKWNGKVYFIENDPDELLRRYNADHKRWSK